METESEVGGKTHRLSLEHSHSTHLQPSHSSVVVVRRFLSRRHGRRSSTGVSGIRIVVCLRLLLVGLRGVIRLAVLRRCRVRRKRRKGAEGKDVRAPTAGSTPPIAPVTDGVPPVLAVVADRNRSPQQREEPPK